MSVSIDTVYQRVLALSNKEQRGYITQEEFNLLANQAQMDLFEQYFYDINQFGRLHGNDTDYSNMLTVLNEKLRAFETEGIITNGEDLPVDLYRLGVVYSGGYIVEPLTKSEYLRVKNSPLAKPTDTRPIYINENGAVLVYGDSQLITDVMCTYIRKPSKVEWASRIIYGEALYDATASIDFELHPSEEPELVMAILKLAGVILEDPAVTQIALQEEQINTSQEKS